jgi:hypothetical protein
MISLRADGLHVAGPKGSAVDRAAAVAMREARREGSAAKIEKWRQENPDHFTWWTTKYGCVVQFWGMRVYYGTCQVCQGLVTKRRDVTGYTEGQTQIGRWPKYCDDCRKRKDDEHNGNARKRMRKRRGRTRYPFDDVEDRYAKSGRPPTPQERAMVNARECDLCYRVISKARFKDHICHPV